MVPAVGGGYPWRDRDPSPDEVERFRLMLSVFKDGSGNVRMDDGTTRADWRQVERTLAECFGGATNEDKGVFDVILKPTDDEPFGLSAKTSQRRTDSRVLMELANSPAKFKAAAIEDAVDWEASSADGIGWSMLKTVRGWHEELRPVIDIDRSSYVVLTHDRKKIEYQLFRFPLELPDAEQLDWSQRTSRGRAIVGKRDDDILIEFYPWSGGQVKFFPHGDSAPWHSEILELETPTKVTGLGGRAKEYWPELWAQAGGT